MNAALIVADVGAQQYCPAIMTNQEHGGRFNVPGVTFKTGKGGLPMVAIENAGAAAEVYLLGATVTHFQPKGQQPVIFVSQEAIFQDGKAIRGGIPICWPWFGPKWDDPTAPQHGLVRNKPWNVTSVRAIDPSTTEVKFEIQAGSFSSGFCVTVGTKLVVGLESHNNGSEPARVEEALHTYLVVGDSKQVTIEGLSGTNYIDKMDHGQRKQQSTEPIRFTGETDRIYLATSATCILTDPVLQRKITVEKSGSKSTVVWNPWIEKAKALNDFGDDEWQKMCCIETANATDDHLMIAAGEKHITSAEISVSWI